MTTQTHNIDPALQDYLNSIGEKEHPVLTSLRSRTQSHRLGKMAIARAQAAHPAKRKLAQCPSKTV